MKSHREVPSRDDFYMGEAMMICAKSKDPNTQVGARIVSCENEPLGTGYNGPPACMNDVEIDWSRDNKKPFILHAEINAIRYSDRSKLKGATIYVTGPPCKACMLSIALYGIKRVVYYRPISDPGSMLFDPEEKKYSIKIAEMSGVTVEEFTGSLRWMSDRINWMASAGMFHA